MEDRKCEHCGGTFESDQALWYHLKMERDIFISGKEGTDYITCKMCGCRLREMNKHVETHGITLAQYIEDNPGSHINLSGVIREGSRFKCPHCGGTFKCRENLVNHLKQETEKFIHGVEGTDYVICLECGMRGEYLGAHLTTHGMKKKQYREKHPNAPLVISAVMGTRTGRHEKPIDEKARARKCEKCGELYDSDHAGDHITSCVVKNPTLWIEGKDYLKCPECHVCLQNMTAHLTLVHGWKKSSFDEARSNGTKLMTDVSQERHKKTCHERFGTEHHWQNEGVKKKREETWIENMGVTNPFASPRVQNKTFDTNMERYGVPHPMQNIDIFNKQQLTCQTKRPTAPEKFLIDHCTCRNLVYTDKIRYVKLKKPVWKNNKWQYDVNPDFMVFPSNVLESAIAARAINKPLDARKHNSKHVIEVFGDYHHSEGYTGITEEEHSKQYLEGYASIGINCLIVWQHELTPAMWGSETMAKVQAFLEEAVAFEDKRYAEKCLTKPWQDKRKAHFACSDGSGEKFRDEAEMQAWLVSEKNLYRSELVEGEDYVVCQHEGCGKRFEEVGIHVKRSHGLSVDEYQKQHPGAQMSSAKRIVKMSVKRGPYKKEPQVVMPPPGVEGEDWVKCEICNFYGKNIGPHIRCIHGEDEFNKYTGKMRSSKCDEKLKAGAKLVWDQRGRTEKPIKDTSQNKTHKQHGLTKEILEGLIKNGLSDAKIGEIYGITGEAVAYYRKKYSIANLSLAEKAAITGKVFLKDAAVALGVTADQLQHWVIHDGLSGKDLTMDDYRAIKDKRSVPEGSLNTEQIAEKLGGEWTKRKVQEKIHLLGIESVGRIGKFEYYNVGVVETLAPIVVRKRIMKAE